MNQRHTNPQHQYLRVRLHTSDETANRYDLWTYGCHAIRYRNWMKEVYVNIISTVKGMDSGINSTKVEEPTCTRTANREEVRFL